MRRWFIAPMIFGVDEVGTGAWAGPFTVCAFAAPDEQWWQEGLKDSKAFKGKTEKARIARRKVYDQLMTSCADRFFLVDIEPKEIDKFRQRVLLPMAMEHVVFKLIDKLGVPDRVIIDGDPKGFAGAEYYHQADGTYPAVMAASIIAKVHRDERMAQEDKNFPGYGFASHVGYGTQDHYNALQKFGPIAIHRYSIDAVRDSKLH